MWKYPFGGWVGVCGYSRTSLSYRGMCVCGCAPRWWCVQKRKCVWWLLPVRIRRVESLVHGDSRWKIIGSAGYSDLVLMDDFLDDCCYHNICTLTRLSADGRPAINWNVHNFWLALLRTARRVVFLCKVNGFRCDKSGPPSSSISHWHKKTALFRL